MHFSIAIRRLIRHSIHRRRKSFTRFPVGPVLFSSLIVLTFLLLVRPPLVSNSEPLAFALRSAVRTAQARRADRARALSEQALYEPLRNRVNAIVGAGHGARRGLEEVYGLPPVVVSNMTQIVASRLYWKLVYADVLRALRHSHTESNSPAITGGFKASARVLFVHTQNGLGNRLRAMASGIAVARATGRIPVVVWERDAHLGASFDDLFQSSFYGSDMHTVLYKDLTVMDSFPDWSEVAMRSENWRPISYMSKDDIGRRHEVLRFGFQVPEKPALEPSSPMDAMGATRVLDHSGKNLAPATRNTGRLSGNFIDPTEHIYFKSAYVATTQPKALSESQYVNFELMNLRPSKEVQRIFRKIDKSALSNAIGVHIRSRTLSNDNVSVDTDCEYTTEGARTTNFWRSRSQLPVFVEKIKETIRNEKDSNVKFFVAADDVKVLNELQLAFPGRILSISRNCDDREQSCVTYALADLLGLAGTRLIYGSYWSSFTEAAARLGNKKVYLSGIDFGKPSGRNLIQGFHDALFTARVRFMSGIETVFPWLGRYRKSQFTNCIKR